MSIVIGAATIQNVFSAACALSAQWSSNPNTQRLYCLGDWESSNSYKRPTTTLSMTFYADGSTTNYSTAPSVSCSDANTVAGGINPAGCGGGAALDPVTGPWFVTSYSYNKDDAAMPGQESWSFQKWDTGGDSSVTLPTYVLRGISEGQTSDQSLTGVNLVSSSITNSSTGSVSAGGFGKAYDMENGTVTSIGGSSSPSGETGQGSANIPYTPLYIS
jgi:hypothetical protein